MRRIRSAPSVSPVTHNLMHYAVEIQIIIAHLHYHNFVDTPKNTSLLCVH
jgi:hypothetical protein